VSHVEEDIGLVVGQRWQVEVASAPEGNEIAQIALERLL